MHAFNGTPATPGIALESVQVADGFVAAVWSGAPEAEEAAEEDELDQMLKNAGKRKGKNERSQVGLPSLLQLLRMSILRPS